MIYNVLTSSLPSEQVGSSMLRNSTLGRTLAVAARKGGAAAARGMAVKVNGDTAQV